LELTHTFTVPATLDETWAAFNDIESVASCFPGATVTSVEGDEFKGSCKVKLGPISLVYNGAGKFLERDDSTHKFVVEAKGKDKRGNGTAGADVTATFTESSPGATSVEVVTDLSITGKPAQFGRGVIQDVSDKLLQQFVDCLESRVGGGPEAEPAAAAPPEKAAAASGETAEKAAPAAEEAAQAGAEQATAGPRKAAASAYSGASAGQPVSGTADGAGTARGGTTRGWVGTSGDGTPKQAEALDLGATVLPVLAKTYWKQAVGALVVLFLLSRLLRRRHR
jgi:carbon monoxide dehydrogenase subunit G